MDKKSSLVGLASVVVTAIVVLLAQKFTNKTVDTIENGQNAALIEQIEGVIDDRNSVVIDGKTMTVGEALSQIATDQAVMKSQLNALIE